MPRTDRVRAFHPPRLLASLLAASALLLTGCATEKADPALQLAPPPAYAADHAFTLDELVALAIHRNAALDVGRYEAEATQGLVDQVKALWLPTIRYDFAATAFDNDMDYKFRVFNVATLNIPLTGTYNLTSSLAIAQILYTGGKRTSGLKQAKMYSAIKKLEVLRLQDVVALDVATYYNLVCLTNDLDAVLEDTLRRMRVFRQVAESLTEQGSLRANRLDGLQAEMAVAAIEQFQIAVRAGRQQAYAALKQSVGLDPVESMLLKDPSLPPWVTPEELVRVSREIAEGFVRRPETQQVSLFTKIRAEQVEFIKRSWLPNVIFLGNQINVMGNPAAILSAVDGLIASVIIDIPIYDPVRRGRLREALGMEQASLAFQRQVEQLITLEIDVTAIEAQRALATVFRAERLAEAAAQHDQDTRQAYSRELVPAAQVVIGIGLDAVGKAGTLTALFNYHQARAKLRRVTADRETALGY